MRFTYGAFEPDQPGFLSDGLQIATNTYPSPIGYRPVGQFAAVSDILPSAPLGAAAFSAGPVFAGTSGGLYRLNGTAWTLLSGGFSASRWSFAEFGAIAVATNGTDAMQKINLTSFVTGALGGTPPTAKILAVVRDFLVAGFVGGTGNKIQWSGINNAEFWTAGSNQCDFQIFPTGGDVTGIFGGETGVILQRNRLTRMTYVGDNFVFRFDEIANNIGCVSQNSCIQAGTFGFFLSDTGFMLWDGGSLRPIGQNRVDRYFKSLYSEADLVNMSSAIDQKNSLVAWTMPERTFIYNWVLDRWSIIEQPASFVFSGNANGDPVFYLFDDTRALGGFTGGPMEAVFQMSTVEPIPGREVRVSAIRPITDAEFGVSLSVAAKTMLSDVPEETDYVDIELNGDMPVRECGRYLKITQRMEPEANWSFVLGLDVMTVAGARR